MRGIVDAAPPTEQQQQQQQQAQQAQQPEQLFVPQHITVTAPDGGSPTDEIAASLRQQYQQQQQSQYMFVPVDGAGEHEPGQEPGLGAFGSFSLDSVSSFASASRRGAPPRGPVRVVHGLDRSVSSIGMGSSSSAGFGGVFLFCVLLCVICVHVHTTQNTRAHNCVCVGGLQRAQSDIGFNGPLSHMNVQHQLQDWHGSIARDAVPVCSLHCFVFCLFCFFRVEFSHVYLTGC